MVIGVRFRIDIESQCKSAVPLQSSTFIVTFQAFARISDSISRGATLGLLFDALAVACYEDLVLARPVLFAQEW